VLDEDVAMNTIDFDDICPDVDAGDQPTFTVTTGTLPVGTSLGGTGSSEWTGTPTTENESGVALVITATDEAEDTDTASLTAYVVNTWTMPDITGDTVTSGEGDIVTAAAWRAGEIEISQSSNCSDTVASGDIISHTPTASAEVDDPYAQISAVVSNGNACTVSGIGKKNICAGTGIGCRN
jgi:hypothetical protein